MVIKVLPLVVVAAAALNALQRIRRRVGKRGETWRLAEAAKELQTPHEDFPAMDELCSPNDVAGSMPELDATLDDASIGTPGKATPQANGKVADRGSRIRGKLRELRAAVEADGGFPARAIVNDDLDRSLLRFLIASDFDVAEATQRVARMRQWREESCVDKIFAWLPCEEKLRRLREFMPSSYHGYDREGHPIHLEQTGKFNWRILQHFNAEELVKMHTLLMEYQSRVLFRRASEAQGRTVDKMCNVLDLRGLNIGVISNLRAMHIFKEVQRIDQEYYPDMVHCTYICNANWVFRAIWRVVKVAFPAREHRKMRIVPPGKKGTEILLRYVSPKNLPKILGGDCDCELGCVSGPMGTGQDPSDYQRELMSDLSCIRSRLQWPAGPEMSKLHLQEHLVCRKEVTKESMEQ